MKYFALVLEGIFVGLKLASVITWSWWLVFLPAIIYFVGSLVFMTIVVVVIACLQAIDKYMDKK